MTRVEIKYERISNLLHSGYMQCQGTWPARSCTWYEVRISDLGSMKYICGQNAVAEVLQTTIVFAEACIRDGLLRLLATSTVNYIYMYVLCDFSFFTGLILFLTCCGHVYAFACLYLKWRLSVNE